MSCGKQLKPIVGKGQGRSIKRAIKSAFRDARKQGWSECKGSSCSGSGEKCGYVVTDMEVLTVNPFEASSGTQGWRAEVQTDGGCACIPWHVFGM